MSALAPGLIQFIGLSILTALYLPVIFFALQRRAEQGSAAGLVASYAFIAAAFGFLEALWRDSRVGISEQAFTETQAIGTLILSFVLMLTTYVFLRRATWWAWSGVATFWVVGLAVFVAMASKLPQVVFTLGSWKLENNQLGILWSALGWFVFTFASARALRISYLETHQPQYRDRLRYWLPILSLIVINDLMIYFGMALPGSPLRLVITILTAYVVLTHNLPDLRQIIRTILVYAITAILIAVFYVAAFLFSQSALRAAPNYNPTLLGAVIALLLALIFTPMLSIVRRMVNVWLSADQYDPGRTLHEYSENISNILDMERLATVAMGIILESMEIQRGFLFLVDQEKDNTGGNKYLVRAIRSPEETSNLSISLDESSPIVSALTREGRPLLQYDLDLLPAYRSTATPERSFFKDLNVEVYVPIFAKRKWIGVLALGSKLSGNRYTEDDLITLSALANQTAVALENARLVDNLMRLNNELRQTRRDLENNNRTLQRLDETKSDFISIASHELRTPLTIIRGYTEMLLEDKNLDPNFRTIVRGIHEGTVRLHEVMDSMFDIAQINSSARQLKIQDISISEIVGDVCNMLKRAIQERKQNLTIDLPSLPSIQADPNLIEKLFQHLLNNAIKFTPNEGRIVITGRILDPNTNDLPHGGVEMVVADTGVGVDPTFREIIFTKFYQPGDLTKHSTSKTRFKGSGTGLGLALCKAIVEAHGGRIWVESPGHDEINFPGSRFHMILPLARPEEGKPYKINEPFKFRF